MKIPFEAWLAEQPVDSDSKSLFGESLLCYRAGAYRAALVFSHLGFLRTLAGKLMTSDPIAGFPQDLWSSMQRKIRDDSQWESEVFDAAVRTKPASIFLVDDDIRQQLHYWRGRRNDAAHSKGNQISYAHVETLWLFVMSSFGKFVVNGGPAGLLERFRRHYDPTFTPPHLDSADLVRQIPQSVPPQGFRDFLRALLGLINVFESGYVPELGYEASFLVDNIERMGNVGLVEAFAAEIKAYSNLLVAILLDRPNFVLRYADDERLIRDLWFEKLPLTKIQHLNAARGSLRVVAEILRNGLVPEAMQETIISHVVSRMSEGPIRESYPADLYTELEPFGFWEAVRYNALQKFEHAIWAAKNFSLVFDFLERYPVDTDIALLFCEFFPEEVIESDHPYPWLDTTLLEQPEDYFDLHRYFSQNPKQFHSIVKIARERGMNYKHFKAQMNPKRRFDK